MEESFVKPFSFLKNVNREMKKVSWPRGPELTRYTIIVIFTVLFLTVFFAVIDLGITQLLNLLFE
nr:preprotein translocase subunit SecE [Gracilibacillus halotolerans]